MKRFFTTLVACLLFFANIPLSTAVNRDPVSRHWENAGFGGQGTFPQIIADKEIPGTLYVASDVSGSFKSTDYAENWSFMNSGTTSIVNANIVQSNKNPDILYSLGLKLIKSVNRGKTWSAVADYKGTRPNLHKSIAIGNTNTDLVFVGLDNGKIMKTINGGASFTEYATPFGANQRISFLYINADDTYLIAGSYNNLGMVRYHLTDDSSSAITLTGTNATRNWDYDTYTESNVVNLCVTAGWKIACTSDNGDNWTYKTAVSADSSYTISRVAVKLLANTNVKFLLHLRQISTPYGTVYDYLSADSGSTWTAVQDNVTRNTTVNPPATWSSFGNLGNVQSMTADPFDESKWYITTDGSIFISTDGGTNWVEKVKGGQNQVVTDIAFSPNGVGFMTGMDIGVLRTTNNGDNWTAVLPHTSNGDPQGFAVAGHYWRVAIPGFGGDTKEEQDANLLAAWQAGNGIVIVTSTYWADSIPRVARSTDNGLTWTIITSGLPTTALTSKANSLDRNAAAWGWGIPRALACHPSGSVCYLGIDGYSSTENGGIFYSTNKGLTWTRTTQPPEWRIYKGIDVDPLDPTGDTVTFCEWFQQAGALPKTYKSTDRGTTWTEVNTGIGDFDLGYNSAGNLFRVGLNQFPRLDYSTNGDSGTWAKMHDMNDTSQVADGLLIDPDDKNRIFVGINDGTNTGPTSGSGGTSSGDLLTDHTIYVTNNAQAFDQAVWTDLTGDFPSPSGVQAIAINKSAGTKGYLFAATDGAGVFRLNLDDTTPTTITNISFGP